MTIEDLNAEQPTLLVVDDVTANIDLILGILDDYDIIPATSGEQALKVLKQEQVDLILLDIVMPGMNGIDLCRHIKTSPSNQTTPVIFITAQEDSQSIENAFAAGAYDYISKPIHAVELRARVQTQLSLRSQYMALQRSNQQIHEAKRALAASEERYRLAMDSVSDGLWDWDVVNQTVYFSPGWRNILGELKVEHDYKTWETRIHHDDKDRVLQSLDAHLKGQDDTWCQDHRLRHADGSWLWVRGRGKVVKRTQEGRPIRMVGTMIDISEQKRNQSLLELRQRLSDLVYEEDLHNLMRSALDTAEAMTDSKIGFYHFVEADQENISLQVWSSNTISNMCELQPTDSHYPISKAGVWVDCIHQRAPVIHNDYASLPHQKGLPEGHSPVIRELTVPVLQEGLVTAVMGVGNKPRNYNEADSQLLQLVAGIAQDAVERKLAEQRIKHMAFYDALTGLPNRVLLIDRLINAISVSQRSRRMLAICYMDLDGFKPINDNYGHHVGDELLKALATRVQQEMREGDTMARLGGDEFILLLNNIDSVRKGEGIVQRIQESIERPFELQTHSVSVTSSIGMTFYPIDSSDAEGLLRHADHAMYQAKQAGKASHRLFDQIQEQLARQHRLLITELKEALHKGFLELYYQPRIALSTGQVVRVEALMRWNNPTKGQLKPNDVLPLDHDPELQTAIDLWAIQSALEQHQAWLQADLYLPISVNISPQLLNAKDLADSLRKLLADYPAEIAQSLELEVLKSKTTDDAKALIAAMHECKALGLSLSLEDSDAMLIQHTPISVIRIDPNKIHKLLNKEESLNAIEHIIALSKNLGKALVAEGVESIEAAFMLAQMGCKYAQGYAIAHPMPAKQLPDWLNYWQGLERWRNLGQRTKHMTNRHDLDVAIFTHKNWMDDFINLIEAKDSQDIPTLDHHRCQLDLWLHGIGLARYGKSPSHAFIAPKHKKVHEIANQIVELNKTVDKAEISKRMQTLKEASDELITHLCALGRSAISQEGKQ